ncbi:MAG: hypothetical protein KGJ34_00500 [Patescibacteria group bacterium]|nr:hypothetical protein [Patescibacteria group bacterium]
MKTHSQFEYFWIGIVLLLGLLPAIPAYAQSEYGLGLTDVTSGSMTVSVVGSGDGGAIALNSTSNAAVNTSAGVSVSSGSSADNPLILITRSSLTASTSTSTASVPLASVTSEEALSAYASGLITKDEHMGAAQLSTSSVSIDYDQPAYFLGFIPVTVPAYATVSESGAVNVRYPWYSFLLATNQSALGLQLAATAHTVLGTELSSSTELSAHEQAILLAAMRTVMQENLIAAVTASTTAQTSATTSS